MPVENGLIQQPRRGRAITVRTPGRHSFVEAGANPLLDDPAAEPADDVQVVRWGPLHNRMRRKGREMARCIQGARVADVLTTRSQRGEKRRGAGCLVARSRHNGEVLLFYRDVDGSHAGERFSQSNGAV